MGILGKDLYYRSGHFSRAEVYFGNERYWIGQNDCALSYGEVLTRILNYDLSAYNAVLDRFLKCVETENHKRIIAAQKKLFSAFCALPFYSIWCEAVENPVAALDHLVGDDNRDELAAYILGDKKSTDCYIRASEDILFVKDRYAWFLDEMLSNQDSEKKKGQRKIPLAEQVVKANLDAFVSGVSLGQDRKVDMPSVRIQFRIRETQDGAELVEKLCFDRILDFAYVELLRGLQKGFVPKRCANCGRWFLQAPGATFAYCDLVAPGETVKTCRDIGALASFQEKVRNNEIWQIHQRAYKKYYARVMKKTMTKNDFMEWSLRAERLRDEALAQYERADELRRQMLIEELRKSLNER